MKKFKLVPILIVALLLPISGIAGDKDVYVINTPLDVNVSNTPMVEVVNTEPMPTVVNNTSSNPIPVTLDAGSQKTIVSAWSGGGSGSLSIRNVPSDKIFTLTDIVVDFEDSMPKWISIKENSAIKIRLHFTGDPPYHRFFHFVSGIPFAPESEVIRDSNGASSITITGYDINF